MSINAEWHKKNRMPKNPTLNERLKWHKEHAENCNCRQITPKLLTELKKRKMI